MFKVEQEHHNLFSPAYDLLIYLWFFFKATPLEYDGKKHKIFRMQISIL